MRLVVAVAHVLPLCVCVCVPLACQFLLSLAAFLLCVCVCVCIPLIKRTRHTQFEDFKVATSAANGQIMTQFLGIFMLVSCSKCGAIVKRQLTTKATLPLSLCLSLLPFLSLGLSRTTKIRKICFNISFSGNFNNNKDNRRCQRCKKHRGGGWGELPSEKVFSNSNNIKRIA